ncbi:MAG TPA: hypothetical protein VND15_01560 [Candidatus Acidoferrales bacterium]|nr:hypothetical protein [Candidatus Acidoferrales bacterium]
MLFLSGQYGSGKTTLAKSPVLVRNGFVSIDSGPLLREEHFTGVGADRLVSTAKLKALDCANPNMVGEAVVRGIGRMARAGELDEAQEIIVIGLRTMRSVRYLRHNIQFGSTSLSSTLSSRSDLLFYLDASPDLLRQRYNSREGTNLSMEKFSDLLRGDFQEELAEMKQKADCTLAASASIKEVEGQFHQILRNRGYMIN